MTGVQARVGAHRDVGVVAIAALVACGPRIDDPGDDGSGTGGESGGSTGGEPGEIVLYEAPLRQLDLLLVVDNSESTASIGRRTAALAEVAVDVLEAPDVHLDYRLGVTTTDSGHIYCDALSSPERGAFVASSCRQRLSDFVSPNVDDTASCLDACDVDELVLPQPWIEVERGVSNVPAGLTTREAAACIVPQGVAGCGFESPLESMRGALELARDPSSPQFGFLRDSAALAIIIVTDEADCSAAPEFQEAVFGPDGNRVFWSLPDEASPSSAVCWNAGVACSGSPQGFDACDPADKDVNGAAASEADAVIVPVQQYVEFLQTIEDDKRALNPSTEILLSVIAGVPVDYATTGVIPYAIGPDGDDPDSFQAIFGIAPGCSAGEFDAVPPVRLRAFADAFRLGDAPSLFSVCADDLAEALDPIVNAGREQIRPACVPLCVADVGDAPGVQPDCTVHERWTEAGVMQEIIVPLCGPDDALPEGANVCTVYLTDRTDATESTADDMQQYCIDEGWNLELRIVRREGFPIAGGAVVSIECEPSSNPDLDCP